MTKPRKTRDKPNRTTRHRHLSKFQQRWIGPPKDKWAKIPKDIMDGEAWRSLGVHERRMLDALICQHFRYCQGSNGELQISYKGFERAGIGRRKYIKAALDRLVALGLIAVKQGVNSNPHLMRPNLYEVTFYPKNGGVIKNANRRFVWIPVETMESAEWCKLSLNARRAMDKLLTEDMFHRGETNGLLRVSHRQFISHGVGSMQRIQDALKELVGAGLLSKTKAPRCGKFEGPNLYRITFKGTLGGPATWRPSNVEPLPKKQRKESWKSTLLEEFKREAV